MSDQLTCPLCAQSMDLTVIPHLRDEHKIELNVFRERFPEQPMCTENFAGFLAERNVRKVNNVLHYHLNVAGCSIVGAGSVCPVGLDRAFTAAGESVAFGMGSSYLAEYRVASRLTQHFPVSVPSQR